MRLIIILSLLFPSLVAQSQYCQPAANCSRGDFIDDFNFDNGAISNLNTRGTSCGFPWNPGPAYWNTNLSATVYEDSSYSFQLGSGNRNQYFAIWVDWNRDQDFDDADEFVYSTNIANSTFSGSFRSPTGIEPGSTRMRVRSSRSTTFGASDACINASFGETEDYLLSQNIRYAPIANFSANSVNAGVNCAIQFNNTSTGYGSQFNWDFGDGSTSTVENPSHAYTSPGTYNVSLTITNSIGNDTEVKNGYITVTASGGPSSPNCTPSGGASAAGFGITSLQFGSSNLSSADAQTSGYEDLSCLPIQLTQGQSYTINLSGSNQALQNYRVWIDWNGDGFLSNNNELELSLNNQNSASGSITVPQSAVLNTALRMRVAGVYNLTAPLNNNFDACSNLNNGQIEDRSIRIVPNTSAPVANFSADPQFNCDGVVQFNDLSTSVPSSWAWDFGDGNSSNLQNPSHTYTANGTYTVKLTVTNNFGSNQLTKFNYITVNGANLAKSACTVSTQSHISDYGIYNVSLNTINKSSSGGEVGYEDFSCEQNTNLIKQQDYTLEIRTGNSNPEDVRVWIDLNDDGSFGSNELLVTSTNKYFHSDTITIPGSAVSNKALRMRISSDVVGSNQGPCDDVTFGQVEDYSVRISDNPNAIVADFTADSTISCTGDIQFSDLTTNNPSGWNWNFGDGGTSQLQNPQHSYTNPGSYTVSLVATKASASDSIGKDAFIVVDPQVCQQINIPENSTGTSLTSCAGKIYDSGGKANYANNTFGRLTISPSNSSKVELRFNSFRFGSGDYLKIYDGPDTNSTLIGTYTGASLSKGSVIIGNSGSLTLVQFSDGSLTDVGFEALWSCTRNPSRPSAFFEADSTESCKGFVNFTDLSSNNPTSWRWDFGDGGSSNSRNPLYFYANQGIYTVRLIASNSFGSDTLTKTQYINVNNSFCFPDSREEHLAKSLRIYPNPSNGEVNIALERVFDGLNIDLIDMRGNMIQRHQFNSLVDGVITLDLNELSSGLYLLRFRSDNESIIEKLRIE